MEEELTDIRFECILNHLQKATTRYMILYYIGVILRWYESYTSKHGDTWSVFKFLPIYPHNTGLIEKFWESNSRAYGLMPTLLGTILNFSNCAKGTKRRLNLIETSAKFNLFPLHGNTHMDNTFYHNVSSKLTESNHKQLIACCH